MKVNASRASVFAAFNPTTEKVRRCCLEMTCAHQRESRSHTIRWLNSNAIWSGGSSFMIRSKIEQERVKRLKQAPNTGPHAMVRLLARVIGIGIETADLPGARECLRRKLRDRRAVARYGGSDRRAESKRRLEPRKGDCAIAEMPVYGAAWSNWLGVSCGFRRIARSGAMVSSSAPSQCPAAPQNDDSSAGPQAADRLVGAGARGRRAGGSRDAPAT